MVLLPVALIIVIIDLVYFIRWVAPSCIYIFIGLDGIIKRLHCSILCTKLTINKVSLYVTTSISNLKLHVCIVVGLLLGLI